MLVLELALSGLLVGACGALLEQILGAAAHQAATAHVRVHGRPESPRHFNNVAIPQEALKSLLDDVEILVRKVRRCLTEDERVRTVEEIRQQYDPTSPGRSLFLQALLTKAQPYLIERLRVALLSPLPPSYSSSSSLQSPTAAASHPTLRPPPVVVGSADSSSTQSCPSARDIAIVPVRSLRPQHASAAPAQPAHVPPLDASAPPSNASASCATPDAVPAVDQQLHGCEKGGKRFGFSLAVAASLPGARHGRLDGDACAAAPPVVGATVAEAAEGQLRGGRRSAAAPSGTSEGLLHAVLQHDRNAAPKLCPFPARTFEGPSADGPLLRAPPAPPAPEPPPSCEAQRRHTRSASTTTPGCSGCLSEATHVCSAPHCPGHPPSSLAYALAAATGIAPLDPPPLSAQAPVSLVLPQPPASASEYPTSPTPLPWPATQLQQRPPASPPSPLSRCGLSPSALASPRPISRCKTLNALPRPPSAERPFPFAVSCGERGARLYLRRPPRRAALQSSAAHRLRSSTERARARHLGVAVPTALPFHSSTDNILRQFSSHLATGDLSSSQSTTASARARAAPSSWSPGLLSASVRLQASQVDAPLSQQPYRLSHWDGIPAALQLEAVNYGFHKPVRVQMRSQEGFERGGGGFRRSSAGGGGGSLRGSVDPHTFADFQWSGASLSECSGLAPTPMPMPVPVPLRGAPGVLLGMDIYRSEGLSSGGLASMAGGMGSAGGSGRGGRHMSRSLHGARHV